ncbi:MAG: tyrosine-protein kinase family protein [Rhodobacteraceae bacterium]|nr:MAG: tyrosine-protein kinase family protein [Paracoccaceae bacterium]
MKDELGVSSLPQGGEGMRIRRRTRGTDRAAEADRPGMTLTGAGSESLVPARSAPAEGVVARMDAQEDLWPLLDRVTAPVAPEGSPQAGRRWLSALYRSDPVAQGFDLLRTRLMQTMRARGWKRIAVAAPRRGAGATFTAVNLALSLARVPGSRTVLLDLNQRHPGVTRALGLQGEAPVHRFLGGYASLEQHIVKIADTLAIGLSSDTPCDHAAEVFMDPTTELVLEDMIDVLRPDMVIYDLPPMLESDDVAAFLPQVDGILLVSDGTATTARDIAECERILQGQTQLLGVVLNRARGGEFRNRGS